ncbi:septum formation initiator family protein [Candidatus Peregrinibacteria bacterium]|nr:septum formation initiator family protein [Candidatus Peregrinibacteria bacterium]
MNTPHISKTTKIVLLVEFLLLAYMLYVLSTSLYKSYQVDRFIRTAEEENAKLEKSNLSLAEDYAYYSSDAWKEKIAKQNFGLVRPGEEVIILAPDNQMYLSEEDRAVKASEQYYASLSNPKKWFLFFFDRERFAF